MGKSKIKIWSAEDYAKGPKRVQFVGSPHNHKKIEEKDEKPFDPDDYSLNNLIKALEEVLKEKGIPDPRKEQKHE